jgi:ABC-2 type transport system permease protein
MLRSVWRKTLRDHRRALPWWALGIAALVALYAAIWPTIAGMPDLESFLDSYPEALRAFFGGTEFDLGTPAGYLQAEAFSFLLPLVFLVFGIGAGAAAIAGEEDRGTLELLLGAPVSRTRIVRDKLLAASLALAALGLTTWLALRVGALAAGMEIGARRLAAAVVLLVLFALVFTALALLLGAATGRRGLALGIPAALAVLSYVSTSLAQLVDALEPLDRLSPYHYYAASEPLKHGLDAGHALVLLGLVAACAALAGPAFERRDVRL